MSIAAKIGQHRSTLTPVAIDFDIPISEYYN